MSATYQGDSIEDVVITIDNSGDVGTTLTGECTITGDSQIDATDLQFAVPEDGSPDFQFISCDSSAEGVYTATFSCTHNGSNTSPAEYPVTCTVGPPPPQPPAIFGSNPAAGSTVNITPEPVVKDSGDPTASLTVSNNAAAGAQDLGISCSWSGDAQIRGLWGTELTGPIAPQESSGILVSCDTATVGSFSATYTCDYTTDTSGEVPVTGTAAYTYECEVREPESMVEPQPAGGTTLTGTAAPGGTDEFTVVFEEVNDEGLDGSVDCSLEDGTDFVLDTTMPADVPAGGSVTVTVTGTAPEDEEIESVSDTLNCTYTDSAHPDGEDVSYELELRVRVFVQTTNVPTLSQWGMAIMALLILGVGLVGFRRYV